MLHKRVKGILKQVLKCMFLFGLIVILETNQAAAVNTSVTAKKNTTTPKTVTCEKTVIKVTLDGAYTGAKKQGSDPSWLTTTGSGASYTVTVNALGSASARSTTITFLETRGSETIHWYLKIEQKNHNWGAMWVTDEAATCSKTGSKHRVCNACGRRETGTIPKDSSNHAAWGSWKVTKAATCTATGTKKRTCGCGNQTETQTIPVDSSNHGNNGTKTKTVDATCTKDGYTVNVCKGCGAERGSRTKIPALGHTWGNWTTDTEPGCETPGTKHRNCTRCNEREDGTIKALEHLYEGKVKTVPETCTTDGYSVVQCSRCGKEEGTRTVIKAGHKWGTWNIIDDAGCETPGTKYRTCTRCNAREDGKIDPKGHLVEGQRITVDATCTKEGYWVAKCSRCGAPQGQKTIIPAKGHAWEVWVTDTPAGCETEGKKHRVCSRCKKTETEIIKPKGHVFEGQLKTVPAGCTKEGYTVVKCTNCDKEAEGRTILPALGHDWGAWNFNHDETCTTDGTKYRFCKRCGTREDGTVPMTGHHALSTPKTVAATCVTDGYIVIACRDCGEPMGEKTILPKTGVHSFGAWVTSKEAECEEAGERYRKCANCPEKETETIKELGHLILGQRRTFTPVGGGEGYTVIVCSRCGKETPNKMVFDVPVPEVKVEFHLSDKHGEAIIDPLNVVCLYKQKMGKVFPKVINPKQYTIVAWRDSAGKQYDENTVLYSTQKLDLYPVWGNVGEYTIFLVGNGATSNEIKHYEVPYDEEFTLPLAKKLFDKGVGFEGWGTAPDGGDRFFADGCTRINFAGNETSITLYALWSANRTITYFDFARNRVIDTETLSHVYTVKGIRAYPALKLDHLTFQGWQRTDKKIKGIYAKEGDQCLADGKDWTFVPVYYNNEPGKIAVVYHDTSGSDNVVVRTYTGLDIELEDVFPIYDSYHYLAGWRFRDIDTGKLGESTIHSLRTDDSYFYYNSIVFLDAVWKRNPEELRLYYGYDNRVEVIIVEDDNYELPIPEDRKGYTFAGWARDVNDRSTIVKDGYNIPKYGESLYAIWDPIKYTIEYRDGITGDLLGEPDVVNAGEKIRTKAPEIPGLTFVGWASGKQTSFAKKDTQWATAQLGEVSFYSCDSYVSELPIEKRRITLYSYYYQTDGANKQTNVIFHPGKGTRAPESQTFTKNTSYQLPDTIDDLRGCVFLGWEWVNHTGGAILCKPGTYIDIMVKSGVESTIILVAKWKAKNSITLSAGYAGGAVKDLTSMYVGGDSVSTEDLSKMISDRPGFTLTGFTASQKYHSQRYGLLDSIYIPENTDFTITANWSEDRHRIYYYNGFSPDYTGYYTENVLGKTKLNFDPAFLALFEREKYVFVGWTFEKPTGLPVNVSSKVYTAADNFEIDLTQDMKVYSCYVYDDSPAWDGETVKVIYDCVGGTGGPNPKEVTYKKTEGYKLSTETPEKDGYFFEGWLCRGILVNNNTLDKYVIDGELYLCASWKPKATNASMVYFQSEYGKEAMPDYMFLSEYETTSWKKISDYCYFAIKTTQVGTSDHSKVMESLVLVVEFKKGEWILTGRSSSKNWRQIAQYEVLTSTHTNDNNAALCKAGLDAFITLLSKNKSFKGVVAMYDIGSYWKELEACCTQNYPADDVSRRITSAVMDVMYKALKKEFGDDVAMQIVWQSASTINKSITKMIKDDKMIVVTAVNLIAKGITNVVVNDKAVINAFADADTKLKNTIVGGILEVLEEEGKDLTVKEIFSDALKTNVEFLRIALTAVVDQMNYRDIARKEFDLFGDGNVKLKTFYDQLGGLGLSPNIKETFPDVLEKIYNAYCYAK